MKSSERSQDYSVSDSPARRGSSGSVEFHRLETLKRPSILPWHQALPSCTGSTAPGKYVGFTSPGMLVFSHDQWCSSALTACGPLGDFPSAAAPSSTMQVAAGKAIKPSRSEIANYLLISLGIALTDPVHVP